MKLIIRLIILSTAFLMVSCATTYSSNPWETPNRYVKIPESETAKFNVSMNPCIEYARKTFNEAKNRFQDGLPEGADFFAIVYDDYQATSYLKVKSSDSGFIRGHIDDSRIINGQNYDTGAFVTLAKSDLIDWYIRYVDRPPEGNLLGKYILLKQDGLATGDCDPTDVEFQRYRYFSMDYSFVPPGTDGWEMRGPWGGADMSMQEKGGSLDELNTLFSMRYTIPAIDSIQELVSQTRTHMEIATEDAARYAVLEHEVSAYQKNETMCALSQQVIEDRKALLSSGKRAPMTREIQALVCLHPNNKYVGIKLNYSHRYHPGKRDPEFVEKANKVFESLAFTTQYY